MSRITRLSKIGLALAAITASLPGIAIAFKLASDNSDDSAYNSAWADSSNGGFGYGAWTLHPTTNTVNNGFFTATATNNDGGGSSSANINVGGDSFGIYANSSNRSAAYRSFSLTDGRTALQVGDTFSWKVDNGLGFDPGSSVGLSLRHGNANSDASDTTIFSGRRFGFEFLQGSTNYSIADSTGIRDTGIGFRRTGVDLLFALTGLNTYSLVVKDVSSGAALNTFTGTLGGTPDQALNSFAVYNRFAGPAGDEDSFFNSFVVNGTFTTTWIAANPGDMLTGSNWAGGNAPNSIDAVATIATQPTGDGNFTLNGTMTLGTLNYSHGHSIIGTGTLNLAVSSGTPEISVNNGNLTILTTISGSSGLNKTGSSGLVLVSSN